LFQKKREKKKKSKKEKKKKNKKRTVCSTPKRGLGSNKFSVGANW
jgi:hypothetical protein